MTTDLPKHVRLVLQAHLSAHRQRIAQSSFDDDSLIVYQVLAQQCFNAVALLEHAHHLIAATKHLRGRQRLSCHNTGVDFSHAEFRHLHLGSCKAGMRPNLAKATFTIL